MDPYRVWLSEIMLQQTTVATVIPRFERFVARWPSVEALAKAADEEVMGEWAGLGYYARARNLLACARKVAASGGFPQSFADLRMLPGIGDYTAAAIAAIAFGNSAAPIDTNVERVIARLYGLRVASRKDVEALFLGMAPPARAGDLAQAMMDLGSIICRLRKPRCGECPVRADCAAFASGAPEAYPTPKAKRERPKRFGIAWWIERTGHVWLVRRPPSGLLGGMATLPGPEWSDGPIASDGAMVRVRHVFTHFELELAVVPCEQTSGNGWWQRIDRLDEAGLPTLYRRAATLATEVSQSNSAAA